MSPTTPKRSAVQHFAHAHSLKEVDGTVGDFLCDGCKTLGSGKRYRCGPCDYDMHDYCATCPLTLSSFMHPQHVLALVVRKPQHTRQNGRVCDICCEPVEGLFYRCKTCEFDVHPLCTQLPQHVRHVLHPAHPLVLSHWGLSTCVVCFGKCESWRYRCWTCGFDVHMECVLALCDTTAAAKATGKKQRGVVPPLNPQPPPYFGYGVPFDYRPMGPYSYNCNHHCMNHVHQTGPSRRRRMFDLARRLTIGVVSNAIFGVWTDF